MWDVNDNTVNVMKEWSKSSRIDFMKDTMKHMLFKVFKNVHDEELYTVNGIGFDETNENFVVIYFKGKSLFDIKEILVRELSDFDNNFNNTGEATNMSLDNLVKEI